MNTVSLGDLVLTNARIVLANQVLEGSLRVDGGVITDIGTPSRTGLDLDGDYLIPGLVELHTDHLETHYAPRPKVRWNPIAAVQAHDAQIAASGITTVLDAIRIGLDEQTDIGAEDMRTLAAAIRAGNEAGRLRADHHIHLRCEVSAPDCLESFMAIKDDPQVRLASLMDHAPGQRQFASLDAYKIYYQGKTKMSDGELDAFSERRNTQSQNFAGPNRRAIAEICHDKGIVLASHDDATRDHVDEALALGIHVAEFPTTMEAARASRQAGMAILMGGPNVVRGDRTRVMFRRAHWRRPICSISCRPTIFRFPCCNRRSRWSTMSRAWDCPRPFSWSPSGRLKRAALPIAARLPSANAQISCICASKTAFRSC